MGNIWSICGSPPLWVTRSSTVLVLTWEHTSNVHPSSTYGDPRHWYLVHGTHSPMERAPQQQTGGFCSCPAAFMLVDHRTGNARGPLYRSRPPNPPLLSLDLVYGGRTDTIPWNYIRPCLCSHFPHPPHPELLWRPRSTASSTRSRTPFWTSPVLTRRLLWVGSPTEEIIRRYHRRRHSRFVNSNLVLFVVDIYPSSRRWLDDPERGVREVPRCLVGRHKERRQAHWDPHPTGLGHSPRWSRCLAVSHVPQTPQRFRLLTTES
jgi:hypothetical protein